MEGGFLLALLELDVAITQGHVNMSHMRLTLRSLATGLSDVLEVI